MLCSLISRTFPLSQPWSLSILTTGNPGSFNSIACSSLTRVTPCEMIALFKRDSLIAGLIGTALIVIIGQACWLWHFRAQAIQAETVLQQKIRERENLRLQSPTPTEE